MIEQLNAAKIVEDSNGGRQIQIDLATRIVEPRRMALVMSMGLDYLRQIEEDVALMEEEIVDELLAAYRDNAAQIESGLAKEETATVLELSTETDVDKAAQSVLPTEVEMAKESLMREYGETQEALKE